MTEDRDATIVKRRRAGESFPAIAASFGKSGPWAWAIVKRLAPDLLGRIKGGVATAPRAPRPPREPSAPKTRPVVSVPSSQPAVEGFHVMVTVQDIRKGNGVVYAHGVDAKSNSVIFTPLPLDAASIVGAIARGKQIDIDVPGHLLIHYDGAAGPWASREHAPKRSKA